MWVDLVPKLPTCSSIAGAVIELSHFLYCINNTGHRVFQGATLIDVNPLMPQGPKMDEF